MVHDKKILAQGSYAWVFIVTWLQVSAFRSVHMFSRQCSLTWAGMIQQIYKRTDKVHVYRADKKQFTHKWCKKLTSHQFLNDAKNNIIYTKNHGVNSAVDWKRSCNNLSCYSGNWTVKIFFTILCHKHFYVLNPGLNNFFEERKKFQRNK